jgi:hypothetical protein
MTFSSSILMIGIVGTVAVILMNVGSDMFLSFNARITESVGGLRSVDEGGGVNTRSGFGRT